MSAYFTKSGGTPANLVPPGQVTIQSGSYIIAPSDYIIEVNGPSITLTLPQGSLNQPGKTFIIKDVSNQACFYPITINVSSPDGIEGNNQQVTMAVNYGSLFITWDGTQWRINSSNYSEYFINRVPYLTPSSTTGTLIQNWIGSTCAAGRNSFWSRALKPYLSNVGILVSRGSFSSAVNLPSGRVILTPYNHGFVGSVNLATDAYSDMGSRTNLPPGAFQGSVLSPLGGVVFVPYNSGNICVYVNENGGSITNAYAHNVTTPAFSGGLLDPYGNVTMIPYLPTSNIGTYNTSLNTYSNVVKVNADGTFSGGVLLPSGNMILVCNTNSNICQYNPFLQTVSNVYNLGLVGAPKYFGGVLDPLGNVIMVPSNSNVGVYNPTNSTFSNIVTGTPKNSFRGGCLLPSGNIIMAPFTSGNVGMVDSIALTYSNSTTLLSTQNSFSGAILTQDGRVILTSLTGNACVLSTCTPTSKEFCMAPYFNKF